MKAVFNKPQIIITGQLFSDYFTKTTFSFDEDKFIELASHNIEKHELKQRSEQIVIALQQCLPKDQSDAVRALCHVLAPVNNNHDLKDITTDKNGVAGWMVMPFTEYVGRLDNYDLELALNALKTLTKRFTSEFGIRHLLLSQPSKCLAIMLPWCSDPCHHVRRLVSEGTRPLLPWAMQLPEFKLNPDWVKPHLEKLKSDESEYVRRSVANHLNDISKTHPDLVVDIAKRWLSTQADKNTHRMVKHACRTLIKRGNIDALGVFGYCSPDNISATFSIDKSIVKVGESLTLGLTLHKNTADNDSVAVLVDYQVHHLRGRGQHIAKVFKWKETTLINKQVSFDKVHSFKPINTRRYYSGLHYIEVLLNGVVVAKQAFELIADKS